MCECDMAVECLKHATQTVCPMNSKDIHAQRIHAQHIHTDIVVECGLHWFESNKIDCNIVNSL